MYGIRPYLLSFRTIDGEQSVSCKKSTSIRRIECVDSSLQDLRVDKTALLSSVGLLTNKRGAKVKGRGESERP